MGNVTESGPCATQVGVGVEVIVFVGVMVAVDVAVAVTVAGTAGVADIDISAVTIGATAMVVPVQAVNNNVPPRKSRMMFFIEIPVNNSD